MLDSFTHSARRAGVSHTALSAIAGLFLLASAAFWFILFWALLVPQISTAAAPQIIAALVSGLIYALILPLLWSVLIPSTPAGMLLQKTQHRTWGFLVVLTAAFFLTWHAATMLRLFWSVQPAIAGTPDELYLTVAFVIAFVLVPGLAWTQTTPEQLIAQLEQARAVERYKRAQRLEEAAEKAAHARAVAILQAGIANATLEQRKELAAILGAFARRQQQALDDIARTFSELHGVELAIPSSDASVADGYKRIAALLTSAGDEMESTARYEQLAARSPVSHQDAQTGDRAGDEARVTGAAAVPQRPAGDEARALAVARRALTGAWTREDLEATLKIKKTTALAYIARWAESGDVEKLTEPRNHYAFVAEGAW